MNHKLLFIVMNGEIKFSDDPNMDHREWYQSLGGNMDEYANVIRGFVMEGKIIYFKENLNYDDEVIDFALKTGLAMKKQIKNMDLKVCCGINPGHDGAKWEPILVLNDQDLEGYKTEEERMKEKQQEEKKKEMEALKDPNVQPIVEFKNDESDPIFIKAATTFTLIMMGFAFLSKLVMIHNKTLMTSNRWNLLLILAQFGGFILSIVGYNRRMSKTKVFSMVSAIASVIMFDFVDIVIGILTALFTMDYTLILKLLELLMMLFDKLKQMMKGAAANVSSQRDEKSKMAPAMNSNTNHVMTPMNEESKESSVEEIPTMNSPKSDLPVFEESLVNATEDEANESTTTSEEPVVEEREETSTEISTMNSPQSDLPVFEEPTETNHLSENEV